MHHGRTFTTLVTLLLLVLAGSAWAFNPVDVNDQWEIGRIGAPSQLVWEVHQVGEVRSLAPTPVEAFVGRYGGDWRYQVNRATGTYHHVYGTGLDLAESVTSAEQAETLARSFISQNQDVFAIGDTDLELMSNVNALGKWSVIFQQTYQGLDVWGGRVHTVFTESGRLFEMGSDAYPGIMISTSPNVTESVALGIAKLDIGFNESTDRVEYVKLMVLPVETGETEMEYRLAYRFDLRVADPFGLWATWVDANSGEILWREDHIRFADYTGNIQGDVEWDSYCDGLTYDYPLEHMRFTISGIGTGYSDDNGDFALSGTAGSRTITAGFNGLWVEVDRYTGTNASHSGTITDGAPYTIDWDNGNSLYAERDCFAYVNKEHDWLKDLDPSYTGVDYEMLCTIERTDGYCPGNAWWDGSGINFCSQSVSYGNTGRMADVIYHEYGHAITDFMYGFNDPPSDLHEGNSDIVANLILRESIMGLGFYLNNCSSGIRNSDNSIQYPCYDEGHYCGQVIAGFHWDSWQEMLAAYPQAYADSVIFNTWHYGRKMGLPQTMPDQVHWTFVADDNDGNLGNGTPHYTQFCVGATNHGFTCPELTIGVFISHTPLDNTDNTSTPYAVNATITSTDGNVVEDSCRVVYRIDGGAFSEVPMMAGASPDEYVGYIPAQAACTMVEYYIIAGDDLGYQASDPAAAPGSLHGFLVGFDIVFDDDFETDQGWTAGLPGDDATTGAWERCDPEGTEAQPENDHTVSGTDAYITQCAAGTSQGSWDIDNGTTTLVSPTIDVSGFADATLSYYRWYSNNTGAEPDQDYWVVRITDGFNWATIESTNVTDRSWTQMTFDIGSYVSLTDQIEVYFIGSDLAPGSVVECGVDDFLVTGCTGGDSTPPTVTVLDPDGGEIITGGGGSTYEIFWEASDDIAITLTTVLFSSDGGATYPDTVVTGALDSSYVWDVPDMDASTCRIKVVCADAAANEGSDESDADFEIRSISGLTNRGDRPAEVVLLQNRPSPFGSATEIEFGLPAPQAVSLKVYTVDGRLVRTLADAEFPAGYHSVTWRGTDNSGSSVAGGVYFYRLQTAERTLTRKMLKFE